MAVNINIPSQVSQTITDGVTDKAPSEDAVHDALALKANSADLGATAFSNDYNDLDNLPSIPAAQIQSDWNQSNNAALDFIKNKPTIPSTSGFVPYTGATTDVDLGTYNITADHINLNVSPSGAGFVVGSTQWNNTIGSSETLLKGGNVTLKNGVDLVARIVNKVTPNTTLTKAAYQAVRVSGAQGGRLAVALAQANNDNNSADTIGLVTETIPTNQEGFIITVGQIENINTTGSLQGETWVDGDVLYLSPTVAGKLTNIKPTGAGHIVVIGYVEYAHANHGKIYVKIMNGWELDELHDVAITSVANNDLLQYDSASSLWKNESLSTAGIQPTLQSGTNIKTINGNSLLGSGDITVGGGITVGTTAVTSGTVGRIFFQGSGNVVQQDAGFIFDSTAKTLTNYGKGALSSNTSFGALALSGNTTGTNNTAFGNGALQFAGSGTSNTAIGFYALNNAAQGSFNGTGNIGIGYYAGAYIISGQNNIAIGLNAGGTLTTGSRNTILGAASLASNSTSNNVVISDGASNNALWKDANHFVGIGYNPTSGTLGAKLDVRAQGALSTDIAFRVRNSADSANLFELTGSGTFRLGGATSLENGFSYLSDGRLFMAKSGGNFIELNPNPTNNRMYGGTSGWEISTTSATKVIELRTANTALQVYGGGVQLANSLNVADGTNVFSITNGTSPSGNYVDSFKLYSADIVAGNAAPHFRTENGNIIKLYQQSSSGITTVAQLVTVLQNLGLLS
jgi:nitrogen fixation protein